MTEIVTPAPAPAPAPATPAGAELANQAPPEWVGTLPEELRGNETLTRYKTVEELARGHIDTKKLASSRLAIPGKDASDEDWGKTFKALGVPDAADGYGDFGLPALPDDAPEADKTARAAALKGYQEQLHAIGVPPKLAAQIVKADIARIQGAQEAYYAQGQTEIEALQKELGDQYGPKKDAAKKLFISIFGEDAAPLADELDQKVGSGRLMRGMMKLTELAGEHIRVDGAGGTIGGGGDPQKQLNDLMGDKTWREKYNNGDPAAKAQYERLLKAATERAGAVT